MKSKKTGQQDAAHEERGLQAAPETGPADRQGAEAAEAHGDHPAVSQAARAVMHPQRHDMEWRYYHGAIRS